MLWDQRQEFGNLTLEGPDGRTLKCHKNILQAKSSFFEAMFEFNDEQMGETVKLDFEYEMLDCMLEFMYTGRCELKSDQLIDLLDLSHQYLLPRMKHAIEIILAKNLAVETFYDTYMVMKAFECTCLYEALITYGQANVKELRQKQ